MTSFLCIFLHPSFSSISSFNMLAQQTFFLVVFSIFALASFAFGERDPTYKACDNGPNDHKMTKYGTGFAWFTSDDPVKYVASGKGACAEVYRDQSNVVCLNPGHVNSANVNGCNKWVQIRNNANGITTEARVLDACGALPNSTFGCNDLFLSKRTFEIVAGNQKDAAIKAGRLDTSITWHYTNEPCWACQAGFPGKLLDGRSDTCTGQSFEGFLRCGRKRGDQRIVGSEAGEVCNVNVNSCEKEATIAKEILARHSKKPKRSSILRRDI